MKYEDWVKSVPSDLKQDALWQFNIYPKTVFLYDLLWEDCERLIKDVRGKAISEQIIVRSAPTSKKGSDAVLGQTSLTSCGWHWVRPARRVVGIIAHGVCFQ